MIVYSEAELLRDFHNGEKRAFEIIYDRYFSVIARFAYSFTKDMMQAEDITIEALRTVFNEHKDFASISNVGAFLYVVVRNASMNHLKSINRRTGRYQRFTFESNCQNFERHL